MIKELLGRYKWLIIMASIASALSALAGLALMSLINQEVALATSNEVTTRLMVFLAGVTTLLVLGFSSQFLLTKLSTTMICQLRTTMVRRILATSFEQIEKVGGHRIHATTTTDVNAISNSLTILPLFAFNLTTAVLVLGYLAWLSTGLFLVLLGVLVFSSVVARLVMGKGFAVFKQLREKEDALYESFKALVDGGKELNLNSQRKRFFAETITEPNTQKIKDIDAKAQLYWNISANWNNTLIFLSLGAVVFASNMFFPATPEVVVGYILLVTYLVGPIGFLMQASQPIAKGKVALEKIESLALADEQDYQSSCQTPVLEAFKPGRWKALVAEKLSYQYQGEDGHEFQLGPIDLHVGQGEVVFLTGGNGSGKSTFAKVLTGLYTASSGQVRLGDTVVDDNNIQAYRNLYSTIFSDFYLFSQVLDHQGNRADEPAVDELLQLLQLQDKVELIDGDFSTTDLSAGQRKRLALLQAVLEDPQIFVFDEWAADQDPHFREYFYTTLLAQLKAKGKTVLVISHDDRYFHLADRLYRFESGQARSVPPQVAAA